MNKVHFITSGSNQTKVSAIKNVLGRLPVFDFYFSPVLFDQTNHVPLSASAITDALGETIESLLKAHEKTSSVEKSSTLVYAIEIQKGITVKDPGPLKHICAVTIFAKDETKMAMATNSISLPEEIRPLILEKKLSLYDAYGELFGEKVKNKELSLYEHLTQKTEASWFEETVFKAFIF